jgi:CDP-ribitol ribitolphosphotransferase
VRVSVSFPSAAQAQDTGGSFRRTATIARREVSVKLTATIRAALVRLGFRVGSLTPLRRRVVLGTSHASRIDGNLAYIREELARRSPDVEVVSIAYRPAAGWWARVRAAAHSLRVGYQLATARVFVVDDYFFPMYVVRKRSGTTFVQVWHACGALKRFGYSVLDKGFGQGEDFVARFPIHSNYDLCLVSAMRFAPFYSEAFRQPIERFTATPGIPRTDLFFDSERAARAAEAVRRRYAIPAGRRVILYAPTFRGTSILAARLPDDLDLRVLRETLGQDHVVLLRAHPFVRDTAVTPGLDGFVIDVSDHPDINELMLVSDVLVTDYSSALFEFALLGRPMAFFAPDHQAYERERGFYVDYARFVPGPVFTTSEELARHLRSGTFDTDRVRRFAADSFDVADGRASARFVEGVVLPAIAAVRS